MLCSPAWRCGPANIYGGGGGEIIESREGRPERLSTPLEKTDAAKGTFVRSEKIINVEIPTSAFSG